MASLKVIFLVVDIITSCFFVSMNGFPDTTIDGLVCLVGKVPVDSDVELLILYMLDDLRENTTSHGYNYEVDKTMGKYHYWGNGACNGRLENVDCDQCIIACSNLLRNSCTLSPGAHVKLRDCRLRYEPYEFHGNW
ncbi:hypothetical protein MLD38_030055 [Melastoma candidum]|uniref:Uncharacterized protein n=1 Tax=Melastoma candidum TaxID=119954 RepID=A0ACB9MKC2_9MYRT|nr:hypothetical protein MLD38_030055 [Melastoma candidum]